MSEVKCGALVEAVTAAIVCEVCGKAAACIGEYERGEHAACDDCCQHGNKDGHCRPVHEWVQDVVDDLMQALDEATENLKALEAKCHALVVVTIDGSIFQLDASAIKS